MLEIRELTRRFGSVCAVDAVSLEISTGQFVGVIGRSGAGKSTLLRMINRLQDPSGGQIIFEGEDITRLKGRSLRHWRSRCAMIFQQFNLVDRLDVLTNVMLGRLYHISTTASLLRLFNDDDRIDAIRTLEWLGMIDSARQHAGTLSGGQQQRVAIARALHQDPKIILADEPIASLDPMNAKRVMDALESIHRDRGITVITNLHTLDTARRYCQRIIGMRDGRVCFDGAPDGLTPRAIREIYGVDEDIDESTTSTSLAPDAPVADGAGGDNLIPITNTKQYAS